METANPPQAVTMREVAARAGVAISTVSRALRNEPCISPSRREAVQAAARQLGYRTNPLVSALMAQLRPRRHAHRPVAVALLHCYPRGQPSFSEDYERGIRERAEVFGYLLEWLSAAGISIPREMAYASLGVHSQRRTAGIDQRAEQVGWAAFDLVVSQINRNEYGLPTVPQTVLVEGSWVDGPTATRHR